MANVEKFCVGGQLFNPEFYERKKGGNSFLHLLVFGNRKKNLIKLKECSHREE